MSAVSLDTQRKVLTFAAITEAGTGLVLLIAPSIVGRLLLGEDLSGVGTLLGRCFGIALLALGLACWPGDAWTESGSAPVRGMAAYNALIALYLGYLGAAQHASGLLLWPAVLLHAIVAVMLVRGRRSEPAPGASTR